MTSIQKIGVFFVAMSLVSSLGVSMAQAEDVSEGGGLGGKLSEGLGKAAPAELKGADDLNVIIGGLISSVIGFLGVVLFVYLLYGGFLYMTAAGDATQVKKAMDVIRSAIIGLVIIASAYAIANFVITSLAGATKGPTTD